MQASIILLLCSFIAAISAQSIPLQVTNALIANTNIQSVITNGGYDQYGITAPPTCTADYPSGFTSPLTICVATTLSYPYRNSSGIGFEVDVVATWNDLLAKQYGAGSSISLVQITPGAPGLFAAVSSALTSGQCQVAITSLFQTGARDAVANASCAYGITGSDYLVGPSAPASVNDQLSSLNDPSITIAVGNGTASLTYIQANIPKATLTLTTSTGNSLTAAATNATMVAVGDAPVLLNYAKNVNPTLCGGNCKVYQLSPPISRIVAYALASGPAPTPTTTPAPSPSTTGPAPAPSTTNSATATATGKGTTTAKTSNAEVAAFSVVAAAAAVVALLM